MAAALSVAALLNIGAAQQPQTAPSLASQVPVETVNGLRIATWMENAPGCDEWLYRGTVYKKMAANGLVITAMLDDFGRSAGLGAAVTVKNVSGRRVLVDPSSWVVFELKPKRETLPNVPVAKLVRSIRRRSALTTFLTAMSGALETAPAQRESGTYDGTDSNGAPVSGDYEGTVRQDGPDAQ